MKMLIPGGISLGFLLIALGVGYLVCAQASKETKKLKGLGYIIGIFIIAVAAVIIINKMMWFCGSAKFCPLKGEIIQQQMPVPQK